MASPRARDDEPPGETLDSSLVDETVPPQRSPLRGALPFGPPAPGAPVFSPSPAPAPAPRFTDEPTAPPQRSPLAAALPFRHAKPSASTVAFAMPTPEDLHRLSQAGPAPGPAAAERARLEQAKTVAFSISPVPEDGAPVAAKSTGHFGLSIEQYAALCAEVAASPHTAEATFARYGLADRKARLVADSAWQERLRADPALLQRWQSLYLHYHEHYLRLAQR